MSDTNAETPNTETSTGAPAAAADKPAVVPSAEENAALRGALAKVQADYAALVVERDGLKGTVAKLEPLAKEADTLRLKVEGFTNSSRESALVDVLRTKLPSAEPLAIRGVLAALSEQGKANRFAEDTATEAAKILKLIESEAPGLTRPATSGGGSQSARVTPAASQRKSLVG